MRVAGWAESGSIGCVPWACRPRPGARSASCPTGAQLSCGFPCPIRHAPCPIRLNPCPIRRECFLASCARGPLADPARPGSSPPPPCPIRRAWQRSARVMKSWPSRLTLAWCAKSTAGAGAGVGAIAAVVGAQRSAVRCVRRGHLATRVGNSVVEAVGVRASDPPSARQTPSRTPTVFEHLCTPTHPEVVVRKVSALPNPPAPGPLPNVPRRPPTTQQPSPDERLTPVHPLPPTPSPDL
jgi:hypothetical protein